MKITGTRSSVKFDLEDGYDKVKVEQTNDFTIGYIKQNLDTNQNCLLFFNGKNVPRHSSV